MYITYMLYTYGRVTETKVVMHLRMIPLPQLVASQYLSILVNAYLIS